MGERLKLLCVMKMFNSKSVSLVEKKDLHESVLLPTFTYVTAIWSLRRIVIKNAVFTERLRSDQDG